MSITKYISRQKLKSLRKIVQDAEMSLYNYDEKEEKIENGIFERQNFYKT